MCGSFQLMKVVFCGWNEVQKVQVEFGWPFSADIGRLLLVE